MRNQLLEVDGLTGGRALFHYDPIHEEFVVEDQEDVSGVIEENKGIAQALRGDWKGDTHHVAQIPQTVWADLVKKGIAYDDAALRRWLDDPDNRVFRTKHGRLSS